MNIELTKDTVVTMAGRLRALVPTVPSHSIALEHVSRIFGHKNWDTLSAVLKKTTEPSAAKTPASKFPGPPKLPGDFTLYADAYCTDLEGEGPGWARLTVTQVLLDELHRMRLLCEQHGLNHVSFDHTDCDWAKPGEYDMRDDSFYVNARGFWIRSHAKHSPVYTETRFIDLTELYGAISGPAKLQSPHFGWANGALLHDSNSVRSLAEQLLEDEELILDDEAIDALPQ